MRLLCVLYVLSVSIANQSAVAQKAENPAYAAIDDKPGLPRVLLLGDSISIGYTVDVRQMLEGVANVHRPATNCSSTRTGAENTAKWLGDKPWDVIHFNFGLHDQKFVVGNDATLVDVNTPDSHHQVALVEYVENLEKIVVELKKSGAKLIWCATTPVPEGAKGRIPSDTAKYNAAALALMNKHEIAVNDLYAFALPQLAKIQRPKDVHYTPAGSKVLAGRVVEAITGQLPK